MSMRQVIRVGLSTICTAVMSTVAMAQTTGQFAVGAGTATDERGIRSSAITIVPSVIFARGADARVSLGGNATFFQSNAWSLGGGLAAHSRGDIGAGFAIALDAGGDASRTSYEATFATGEVTPALEYTWSALTLFGGVRGAAGYTRVTPPANLGPLPGAATLISDTRTLYAPTFGGRLRIMGETPDIGAEISYREQPMHVGSVLVTDRSGTGALVSGPLTLVATVGHRDAPDERLTFASGTFEYEVVSGVSLDVSGGRYPSNRLTGAAGGTYMSAGLSLSLGGNRAHVLPQPRGVGAPPAGTTRLSIDAPDAQRVDVAGDWNDWQPTPATRAENGVWYVDVRLAPGQYRYSFRLDGDAWRVPGGAVAVDDGFGGKSAYVTVRDANAADSHNAGGKS